MVYFFVFVCIVLNEIVLVDLVRICKIENFEIEI